MSDVSSIAFGKLPVPVVLFDANVLFQAAATRFLLGGARAGLYRAAWTREIEDEARRNLVASGRTGALAAFEQNRLFVRDAVVASASAADIRRLRATHADDRHVLAAAIKAEAAALVTDNVKDFGSAEAEDGGVVVVPTRQFAGHLAQVGPAAMAQFVERVPPERFKRYVEALRRQFPEAIECLAAELGL